MSASYVIAIMMALASAEGTVEDPAPAVKAEAKPDAAASSKLICRKVEELGSRLRANKVCMTRSEWAEQKRLDRANLDRSQRVRWGE